MSWHVVRCWHNYFFLYVKLLVWPLTMLQENKIMEMKEQIRAMEGELTNVVKEQAEFTVQMNDAKVTAQTFSSWTGLNFTIGMTKNTFFTIVLKRLFKLCCMFSCMFAPRWTYLWYSWRHYAMAKIYTVKGIWLRFQSHSKLSQILQSKLTTATTEALQERRKVKEQMCFFRKGR